MGIVCLTAGGTALFLSSWLFPWDMLQKVDVLNMVFSKMEFSFRFLMIAGVFVTIPAAIGYAYILKENMAEKQIICLLGIFFAVTLSFLGGTLEKRTISNKSECISQYLYDTAYLYQNADAVSWKANDNSVKLSRDMQAAISEYRKDGASLSFYYEPLNTAENSYFDIPLAYYPGYVAEWNGKKLETGISETGMLRIHPPGEEGMIEIRFREKPLWLAADLISLVSWCGMVLILYKKRKVKHDV